MSLVIDASVAIKWFVQEELHAEAVSIFDRDELLFAPDLLVAEVTNTAWKKVRQGQISTAMAEQIATTICSGKPLLYSSRSLNGRALQIALSLGHPVYDCYYLACAELIGGSLITDDRDLFRTASSGGITADVRLLADFT